MAKTYQWRTQMGILQGGYPGEPHGVNPADTGWRTADIGSGTTTNSCSYYYVDSDSKSTSTSSNASTVTVNIEESWTTSVNNTTNVLSVTVHTVITSITRSLAGNAGSTTRDIVIAREAGSSVLWSTNQDGLHSHTLATNLDLGTYTFDIAPGQNIQVSTVYYLNHSHGYDWDPKYVDEMAMGVRFMNTLPNPITYNLNFDQNFGTGGPGTMSQTNGDGQATFVIPNNIPTKPHGVFLGWDDNDVNFGTESNVVYRPGDSITMYDNGGGSPQNKTIHAVWEYTYRPGKIYQNGSWLSHDRDTNQQADGRYATMEGRCHIRRNGNWEEMRTRANKPGLQDPPAIRRNGEWVSQALIGDRGSPHDVSY